jgi:predicted DNA binding protein
VLAWWTNFDQDVLEAAGWDSLEGGNYRRDLRNAIYKMGGRVSRSSITDSKCQLVVRWSGVAWEYSTSRAFVRNNSLLLQPTIHTEGWEWYRAIAFSEEDLKGVLQDLDQNSTLEVLTKRAVEGALVRENLVITASGLLGGLTGFQAEALIVALKNGYYSIPKRVTTEDISQKLGISRPTYEEHLRKAESKVLTSMEPFIYSSARMRRKTRGSGVSGPLPAVQPVNGTYSGTLPSYGQQTEDTSAEDTN